MEIWEPSMAAKNSCDCGFRVNVRRDLGITDPARIANLARRFDVRSDWRGEPSLSAADAATIIAERRDESEAYARGQQEQAQREETESLRRTRYVNQVRDVAIRFARVNERHESEAMSVTNRVVAKGIGDPDDAQRIARLVKAEFGPRRGIVGTFSSVLGR
jgi:hypothetical protein